MKSSVFIILNIIILLLFNSCSKFLDINPSTQSVNPTMIKDFQEMLNNDSLGTGNLFLLDLMSDDIRLSDTTLNVTNNRYSNSYLWNAEIWNGADIDPIYNGSYARILQMNIILNRLPTVPNSDTLNTIANSSNVKSQALLHRAWYYFLLTNTYGKSYNQSSASTDLSVPIVTTPDASTLPSRNTVEAVYDFMIGDIKDALNNSYLANLGTDIIHPGKVAGYGLLSRVYLFKANYDSALIYADSALQIKSDLLNYSTNSSNAGLKPTQLHDLVNNPEVIWGHVSIDGDYYRIFSSYILSSASLINAIGSAYLYQDYRYYTKMSFGAGNYYLSSLSTGNGYCMDNSLSVPELMLIKAECLARAGNVTDAGNILNTLRNNRYYVYPRYGYYVPVQNYDAGNILNYVLLERRRELFFHGGLRWFDLKRLNSNSATEITISRRNNANDSTIATLAPGSNRYQLPFTQTVLANNTNIIQNPRN